MADSHVSLRRVLSSVRFLAFFCLVLASIATLAAECKIFKLDLPETDTLGLKDGEHVLGSTTTGVGRFEARVTVKEKVVSPPRFYIRGKLMTTTPDARVPAELRDCLKKADPTAALPSRGWLATLLPALRDLIEPPAYAYQCKTVMLGCVDTIGGMICCARTTCAGQTQTACGSAQ